jgi:hypothetical protein
MHHLRITCNILVKRRRFSINLLIALRNNESIYGITSISFDADSNIWLADGLRPVY